MWLAVCIFLSSVEKKDSEWYQYQPAFRTIELLSIGFTLLRKNKKLLTIWWDNLFFVEEVLLMNCLICTCYAVQCPQAGGGRRCDSLILPFSGPSLFFQVAFRNLYLHIWLIYGIIRSAKREVRKSYGKKICSHHKIETSRGSPYLSAWVSYLLLPPAAQDISGHKTWFCG